MPRRAAFRGPGPTARRDIRAMSDCLIISYSEPSRGRERQQFFNGQSKSGSGWGRFLHLNYVDYEGDIMLDLTLENSARGGDVVIAGQALPAFSSRKVTTRLRLRDGESNLLAGLLRGMSPADAGRLGSATGACCVTQLGATAGIRSFDETAQLAGL